ncbi:Cu(I)/Ag(I) efflux system membrane fusion protein [Chitinophaga polysaccharea]|uniref:Cu(I)/Ag(I) efflux system membrane fusion protein n=1 Tax=Chitinophaga polysaccharea TaxID=1293035 RepID=A0A561PW33_9BACT|nr:efflux RND transporter periplasmic adaptor subunit [Chitinophaga polysaccharea]TWF42321.1 Cu(I)/Ag(I) efflux system membrane fusion protein [Chitinophaga polysaccharea]
MERKKFIRTMAVVSLAPALLLAACKATGPKKTAEGAVKTYTCPMHPQIVQEQPGSCPICGMDLVLFDKNNKTAELTLGDNQVALANITTMTIGAGALANHKQLNGRLTTDPEQTAVISSRVAGRIEVLYVKETGVRVAKGQPLYKIYSEQLASLQQEYLLAVAQLRQFPGDSRFQQIEKAARQKLSLYDQSEAQISQLLKSQQVNPYVTYPAAISGIVSALTVSEGQYIPEGGAVMRVEGYDHLWVVADVYPAEISLVRTGQPVKVVIAGWENEPQTMTIQFINPALQAGSQLMQVRGTIPNPGQRWQPGLQASIFLPVNSKGNVLSVPVDAVIRDGKGTHVWIEKVHGKFVPRMVSIGMENAEVAEITGGLQAGDNVVVTGAYLLYSEFILKKGADPMAGMSK